MNKKFVLCCFSIVLVLLGQLFSHQLAISAGTADEPSGLLRENSERAVPSSLTGSSDKSKLLTLNLLRDSGLSLQQIKQQAINIYLEVTRRDFQPGEKSVLVYPKSISYKGLLKTCPYLPPRAEWLYFYVGTMEPIIHLFSDEVNDTKSGITRIFVPKAIKSEISPLWKEWGIGIENLNEHLTAIYKLANEDKPDNIALGKHAVAMYDIGIKLENTRQRAVAKIRKSDRRGIQSEPVGIQ